ncbi:MAG TPA: nuclear transport factor 2 family protein [Gammaproteobacteria bacterium]|nr:nuclear transport factor 2 family protein [Gammaproteobacteria bacterium]
MTRNKLIELARAYVALSNAHHIEHLMAMFAAGAGYRSTTVGDFRGRAAIADMMHEFFTSHPDVYWEADNYRCDEHRVSFDFTMTADRNDRRRSGVEHLDFTADGSIKKVTVEAS